MRWFTLSENSEILAIHAALLHTGHIIYFGGDEYNRQQHDAHKVDHTRLFNCSTFEIQKISSPTSDVFCCGHAMLADGRLIIGGGIEAFQEEIAGQHHCHAPGIRNTWLFDPVTLLWEEVSSMNKGKNFPGTDPNIEITGGRWYPTLITLPDGRVLAFAGHPGSSDTRHVNNTPEIFSISLIIRREPGI